VLIIICPLRLVFPTEEVCVITCDGRSIVGVLAGFDQLQNLILKEASERVYSPDAEPETVPLGLYVIRGDNVAIISDRDEDMEASAGLSSVRAEPLDSVVQNVG
jgi:U6 snRNA-associated Sm-like protein LSm8